MTQPIDPYAQLQWGQQPGVAPQTVPVQQPNGPVDASVMRAIQPWTPPPANITEVQGQGVSTPTGAPVGIATPSGQVQFPGQPAPQAPGAPNVTPLGPQAYDEKQIAELENQRDIAAQTAQIQKDAADREAEVHQRMFDASRSNDEDNRVAMMTHAAAQAQDADALRQRVAAVGAMNVDPNHWWNSKSTGGKIAASIGSILGGFAQGALMNGGNKGATNPAVDQANRAIADDVDAQKSNISNQWKDVQGRFQLHDDDETRFLHEQAARTQSQLTGLEAYKYELNKSAAMTTSQLAQLGVAHANADITAKQDALRNHLDLLNKQTAATAAAAQAARLAQIQKKKDEYDHGVLELQKDQNISEKEAHERFQNTTLGKELRAMGVAPSTEGMSTIAPGIRAEAIKAQAEAAAKAQEGKAGANPEAKTQVQALEQIMDEHATLEKAKKEGNAEGMKAAVDHINDLRRQALNLPARIGADGKPVEGIEMEKSEHGLPVRAKGAFGPGQSIPETIAHNFIPIGSELLNKGEDEQIDTSKKFYRDMLQRARGEKTGTATEPAKTKASTKIYSAPVPRGEDLLK